MQHFNTTTPHVSPLNPRAGPAAYYVLIPFVLLTLIGCAVATVAYMRRKIRLDELRHRLIPLYTYNANGPEEDWGDAGRDEEEELAQPLYKDGKLTFTSDYGT